nr:MAG TPA: hypothetical protein [Microviridae sp.]
MVSKSTQSKYQHQQRLNNMDNKFRNQLLAESKQREEELKEVNLEIEERTVSEKGPFVLIRNKNNKWVITTCGALVNGKEFDTKEDAEKHLSKKTWEDILTAALIFISHVNNQMTNTQKE